MAKGFKAPRPSGGMGGMMGQLQKLQQQIQDTQAALAEETVTYTAGGGVIKIVITGDQRIKSIQVEPDFLKDTAAAGDAEMMQDLLLTAFNGALDASRKLAEERMGPLAGALPF